MSTWRPARLLLWVGAAVAGASLFTIGTAGIAEADLSGVVALKSSPTPGPRSRNVEDEFYSDIHPATPDQQLSKPLEKKADAQAAYMEGLLLEEEGDYESALAAYSKSLQLDPGGNPRLTVRVAHDYAKRGDIASGIDILKDLALARPDEPLAYLNLAYFYLNQLKKPNLALKYAQKAVAVDPKNFAGYQMLFEVYVALKQPPDAESTLVKAQKLESNDPNFWLNLAELTIQLYASDQGTFPAQHVPAVDTLLKKAAGYADNDGSVYAKIGDDYVLIDQVASAIPFYLRTLELNKDNADVRFKLAQSFLKNGQRDQAIHSLEEMVKNNPTKFEIYEFLARLYEEAGNKERALANYEQALLIAPDQPELYLGVAQAELSLREYDRAIGTLEDARRRFAIPQITYSLAIALSSAKRFADALPIFEAALQEAETRQEELLDGSFFFNYGATAEQAGLVDKAATLLKRSIELDPSKAAQAYNYLGFMWVDRNMNLDEAGLMIKKALDIEPENGAYLDSLGWFYYKKGDFPRALTELLHAADLINPPDPVVYEHIGDTYKSLGNTAQALAYWQKGLTLDPQNQSLATKIDQAKAKVTSNPSNTPFPIFTAPPANPK
ncbi:MAG TPA: tetratricopeptide repeat protein [Chthoniobacterales bacterium]|nr:tetratricopeptide repeat protein [Chthoniobacterales bacterium]